MAQRIKHLNVTAKLPDPQTDLPVFTVRSASLDERRGAIETLGEHLELGRLGTFELKDSLHFGSQAGEVQFYRPSGALRARNVAAGKAFDSEVRPWENLERSEDEEGVSILVLGESTRKRLVERARAVLERAGLVSEHGFLAGVDLEQVAELDAEGKQIGQHAGEATVRYRYRLQEIAVAGAGAKSYLTFNPGARAPQLVGAFHAWREIVDARAVRVRSAAQAVDQTLAVDRELIAYHKRGYTIELNRLDVVYYARPAFAYQTVVFPALRVKGRAMGNGEHGARGFEFARYVHVASPEDYARADLFADYLMDPL